MLEDELFRKGLWHKDKTNEKVVYNLPIRKDDSIERTKDIVTLDEAIVRLKELVDRIDNAGENGGNLSDAADITYLAEKFGMTYGQVNEVLGTKDWLG